MVIPFLTSLKEEKYSKEFYSAVSKHFTVVRFKPNNKDSLTENDIRVIISQLDSLFDRVISSASTFEDCLCCWLIAQTSKREGTALAKAHSVAKTPEDEVAAWRLSRPSQPLPLSNEALVILRMVSENEDESPEKNVSNFLSSLLAKEEESGVF